MTNPSTVLTPASTSTIRSATETITASPQPLVTSTKVIITQTPTETPTQGEPTEEPTPTVEPTPTPVPPEQVIVHPESGLTQGEVAQLANSLPCQGCIETGYWSEGSTMDAYMSLIATGRAITREVKNTGGEIIGYFDLGVFVVKDATGEGKIVEIPTQVARIDQPEVNIFASIVDYFNENYDDLHDPTRYPLERISEIFPKGRIMGFGFSSYACHPGYKNGEDEFCSTYYDNPQYIERLKNFVDTGELSGSEPLILLNQNWPNP
jgi:hypothetical protein